MSRDFTDFEWYGGEVIKNVEEAKKVALTHACKVVQADAKANVPIDTGNLKGSLTYSVLGDSPSAVETPAVQSDSVGRGPKDNAIIGTNVEYGIYQEYGFTHWRSGNFIKNTFLRPALDNNRAKILREIGDFIKAATDAGGGGAAGGASR